MTSRVGSEDRPLRGVPRAELEAMLAAGREVLHCQDVLAKTGDSILGELLASAAEPEDWQHYPPGDVYDPASHAQYFYHRHAPEQRIVGEHGHFHTFLRPRGMPKGTLPLMLPELAIAGAPAAPDGPPLAPVAQPNQGGDNDKFSHLIAIAVDDVGRPVRLFATNRWVTAETWYRGEDVIAMLDRFVVELARPSFLLNRWLSALFRLFRPQMARLIQARDETIMGWRRRHRGKIHVFEDRRLEVAAQLKIDVDETVRRLESEIK